MEDNLERNFGNEVAVVDETQMKQFKSLYYLIKGKRDTDIKLFTEYRQFEYSDIIELNRKIYSKLELHESITDIVNVTVGLSNKEIKSFGNWTEFVNTDWNIAACTKYISIEWDFNLILPNQTNKVPQTHTLRVRIGNSLKPSEMIHVVFQGGEEYDLEEAQAQMSCKIDFINAQICNEFKTVVSEWYDSLRQNSEEHKLIRFSFKHKVKLQNFVVFSYLAAGVILSNFLFSTMYYSSSSFFPSDTGHKLFLFISFFVLMLFVFYQSGKLLADRMIRKQLGRLRRNPMFDFTKGDKNKFTEVAKNNKKHLVGILKTIAIGILINGISAFVGCLFETIVK